MVATVRITFVNLLPALAFQLDMRRNTESFFGINEALFSSTLAAVVFSLLSARPLTVVGITSQSTILPKLKVSSTSILRLSLGWPSGPL